MNEEILDVDAWNLGTDHLCAYSDGSCTQELSREMKRASWGLIFYNSSNKAIARHFGAIPAYLWQSSAAGEFAGLALALEVAPRDTSLVVDCKAVDHVWHLPLQKQLAASQVYAGVLLSSLNTTTVFGSKRIGMGTSSGERSMSPLLSSIVRAAERMQDGACAD